MKQTSTLTHSAKYHRTLSHCNQWRSLPVIIIITFNQIGEIIINSLLKGVIVILLLIFVKNPTLNELMGGPTLRA